MNQHEQPTDPEPPATESEAAPPTAEIADQQAIQQETTPAPTPRIWVTSELDAANGITHGRWIDANQPVEQLRSDIDELLATSPYQAVTRTPATSWTVADSRDFGDCSIREHADLQWITLVAQGIVEHGLAFAAWADVMEEEEHLAGFDTAYLGHYDSLHAYIEQLINDLGYDQLLDNAVPASIRPYVKIDITATANDLLLGGDLHALPAPGGGVWIFRG
ncbi:MAG: antirestriction protein ArdA [Jatrophihabitans sp.]